MVLKQLIPICRIYSWKGVAPSAFLFLIFMLTWFDAVGQTFRLSGNAIDGQDKSPLIGAHIKLTEVATQRSVSTVADTEGAFSFSGLKNSVYQLTISYVGYESLSMEVRVDSPHKQLKTLKLNSKAEYLDEIEITDNTPRAEQRGDTTAYNANAFKTAPDAAAEDLIKKMPGMVIEGNSIKAQGENVRRILVDGKRFFGDDPYMALRNLPAEIIEKIEVFDQMSEEAEFTGFDDGESVRTINIVTRNRIKNGSFGKVSAGVGSDDRYMGGGNINLFKEDRRLSVVGQTNNINKQNFAMEDLMGVMEADEGRGNRGSERTRGSRSGNLAQDFLVGSQNGTSVTHALGINYSNQVNEKIELSSSYFFNHSDNTRIQNTSRDYFLRRMNGIHYEEETQSENINQNHRLNMRLDYTVNPNNSFLIAPRISFQGFDSDRNLYSTQYRLDELLSDTTTARNSFNDGYNVSNLVLYRHKFVKPRRTLSVSVRASANKKDGANYAAFGSPSQEQDDPAQEKQKSDILTKGYSVQGNVRFTEPVGKIGAIQASYNASMNENASDKYTYDFSETLEAYSALDTLFSNVYQNDYLTQTAGLSYGMRIKGLNLSLGVDQQWATLAGRRIFPQAATLKTTFSTIMPNLTLNYRLKNRNNLNLRYRTRTNSPSIDDLQDVIDNNNPMRLTTGNPNLKQDYRHEIFVRYNSSNTQKGTSFFLMIGGSITNDFIARSTFIAPADTLIADGVMLRRLGRMIRPVNLDGSWNIRSFTTYGMPVKLIKSNLNLNASVNYSRMPGMTYDPEIASYMMNFSRSLSLGSGFTLSSNISKEVDFTITTMANYNLEKNSILEKNNTNYYSHNSSGQLSLVFFKSMILRTSLRHQLYSGLSEGFNESYFLWNLSLGKKLFRKKNGEISISVTDALNDNQNFEHRITESFVEDVTSNVLSRHAILSFTYNLRKFR